MGRAFLSRWALPVSLALNVFLGTVLVMREPGPPPRGPGGGPPSPLHLVERMAADLPPADAAILRTAARRRAQEVEYQHSIWIGVPQRVGTALAAPDFDPEALRAVLAEGRRAHRAEDDAIAEVIIEAASAMSAEGRHAIARWRPPHPSRGGPPPQGDGPPPPR
ncbi:periplasmic heavy metal sensor [Magnetospirillum sp. 15-1]|uniref:periplasmic heavy metal sensor n=1 Tax=Magnetospirillum sp. 15-1 TaxID=1979370 RepID=UPI000BBBE3D4|nr:periplasmic heavy metal sensor [Magnetospirillum sp. 15-1]